MKTLCIDSLSIDLDLQHYNSLTNLKTGPSNLLRTSANSKPLQRPQTEPVQETVR